MALPAPNLDDRRFQDLVDDAKRLVMQRCPEWTDHNVSDPGVTLIETFAFMTDQLLYRLNRVPDRLYVKFLELIGVRLFPPTPARTGITFWLSAPLDDTQVIAPNTKVATPRTESEDPVVFSTLDPLSIVPCSLQDVFTEVAEGQEREHRTESLELAAASAAFPAFSDPPVAGDALVLGVDNAVPGNAVRLRFRCHIDGVGVDPDHPPLAWEAFDGEDWHRCEVEYDTTGGLNREGDVVLHVPDQHQPGVIESISGAWIRARVTEPDEGLPAYSSPPLIHGLDISTIGGTTAGVHAEVIENEAIGISEGVPGQIMRVLRYPILSGLGAAAVEVSDGEGWQDWEQVAGFEASGPDDRHFLLDAVNGEVQFGPVIREPDGALTQHGAVPPKAAHVRMARYTVGGGRRGNIGPKAIKTLKSSIPFVSAVENRQPAQGGVDGETIDQAKDRGPIVLRTRSRAVTAEDYEHITREAAPEIARVRCVPAGEGPDAGGVKVLVVPAAPSERGRIRFEDLIPGEETLARITERLDETRMVGTRVLIEPPTYRGVTLVARLRARAKASPTRVREEALEALDHYFSPLDGGPDGEGWPWGRPVQAGEVYAVLQRIRGVDIVEDARLFGANPVTGDRGEETERLELEADSLCFSYEHQILVEEP